MGSIQKGAMVRRNDNGTLERVDGSNTYIGSATLESGKVLTKRFRGSVGEEDVVVDRWLKWQGRNVEDTEAGDMADNERKTAPCPFSGEECGPRCPVFSKANGQCSIMLGGIGLYNIAANMAKLDASESIELVAMAVSELKGGPGAERKAEPEMVPARALTVEDGISGYLEGKRFLDFVNLHSKTAYSPYKRYCDEKGFPAARESDFTKAVKARFPELKVTGKSGGSVFTAA